MQMTMETIYHTYHPQSFLDLKDMVSGLQEVYHHTKIEGVFSKGLNQFLTSVQADREVVRIVKNTADYGAFRKMFWHWFDAFLLMKYLHFVRDRYYPDVPVLEAVNSVETAVFKTSKEALIYYRGCDVIS